MKGGENKQSTCHINDCTNRIVTKSVQSQYEKVVKFNKGTA